MLRAIIEWRALCAERGIMIDCDSVPMCVVLEEGEKAASGDSARSAVFARKSILFRLLVCYRRGSLMASNVTDMEILISCAYS